MKVYARCFPGEMWQKEGEERGNRAQGFLCDLRIENNLLLKYDQKIVTGKAYFGITYEDDEFIINNGLVLT
jgi:hypothetical protein